MLSRNFRTKTFSSLDCYLHFFILTNPSAPILPLPVTLNAMSTSHQSKLMGCFDQIAPFWLLREGAIRTFSELAIASK